MPTLTPSFREFLPDWLASRSWFAGSARDSVARVGGCQWEDPAGEVGIDIHLIAADHRGGEVVYHVPFTFRSAPVEGMEDALVAVAEHSELGTRYIYDGVADPVYLAQLQRRVGGEISDPPSGDAAEVELLDPPADHSRTTVVSIDGADGPARVTVVRQLHDDPPSALSSARKETPGLVTCTWDLDEDGVQHGTAAVIVAEEGGDASLEGLPSALQPRFSEFLPAWLTQQRWYVGGGKPRLRPAGFLALPDEVAPDGSPIGVEVHLIADLSGDMPVVYQVPLTYRTQPLPGADHALVTQAADPDLGDVWVYDGCHDPAFVAGVIEAMAHGDEMPQGPRNPRSEGRGVPLGPDREVELRQARVLTGEQSNTSIILDAGESADPLILKVFRVVSHGENPDVSVQVALSDGGCDRVPVPFGALEGSWAVPSGPEGWGHLAFAQEFLPGVEDAWRVALRAARADEDFTQAAAGLGAATAAVHAHLAQQLPSSAASPRQRGKRVMALQRRFAQAAADMPALGAYEADVKRLYAEAEETDWPALQRVHGDLHLGQVLYHPERGWILLDFEGEPLRPMAERNAPDLALRDVAGMLRSFDYAAGSIQNETGQDRSGWAQAAREAFLDGYAAQSGIDPRDNATLLRALELDKALYEVSYETRHRPAWVHVPRAAIARILAAKQRTPAPQASRATPMYGATASAASAAAASQGSPAPAAQQADRSPETTPEPTTTTKDDEMPAVHDQPTGAAMPLDRGEAERLVRGEHHDPHSILGAHPYEGAVTVRALRRFAKAVRVHPAGGQPVDMTHEHEGVWSAVLPESVDYRIGATYEDGVEHVEDDPYRYLPTLGEVDLHLIGEGRHEQLWHVLGANVKTFDGPLGSVTGTSFAVWAPNARAIRLVGDFNHWDGTSHPMRSLGSSGVWELFVPGVGAGAQYKFDILGSDGHRRTKADPLARATECPPATASVVAQSEYAWGDEEWIASRAEVGSLHDKPMSVYEVHLGSWRQGSSYEDLAEHLVNYVSDLGFTHVELMPVMEHPYGPSWGYQVTGYFAPTARFGDPDGLRLLIDRLHQAGIGVILDWVPAHFPKDAFALARFDGQPLYEHPDSRRGEQPDWGTLVFDFGRPQVRNFLVASALYWMEEFHVDGLRVDAVASMLYLDYSRKDGEWEPNQYGGREHLEAVQLLQETNATVYRRHPGVTMIAEESTAWPGVTRPTHLGGLGFGMKWNMGWMHDTLDYVEREPIHRQYHHHQMTFGLVYAYSENYVLPISHDEVVHGKGSLLRKMPGDRWQQRATLRAYLAFMWSHPGKQLLFMGSEMGQEAEWSDARSLDWWLLDNPDHLGIHQMVKALNGIYKETPALWQQDCDPSGFTWIDANDAGHNTYSYVRYGTADAQGKRQCLVAVVNFSGGPQENYRLGLPHAGTWREVLNTDASEWGGSGVGNMGAIEATNEPHHAMPASALVRVPPLGAVWFVADDVVPADEDDQRAQVPGWAVGEAERAAQVEDDQQADAGPEQMSSHELPTTKGEQG